MMLGSITRSFSITNHHKMFGIVTADEDDASFSVDRERFDYCYPRWCNYAALVASALDRLKRSR